MNGLPNRHRPASSMTKLEAAALHLYAHSNLTEDVAIRRAHAFFDALEHVPELDHEFDEFDFDHEGTP